jgi:putative transposase
MELAKAREWVLGFVRWYNEDHRHSAIKFVTPQERHTGADIEILNQRTALYESAKAAKPERWHGKTRDWSRPELVWLNPD